MGCQIIIFALFVIALFFGLAVAVLSYFLGWYALLAIPLLVAFVAGAIFLLGRRYATRLFLIPFLLKGRVLKGARAEVHDVQYLGMEERTVAEKDKVKEHAYLVDLTIRPSGLVATPFKMWDPYELMPVPVDAKVSYDEDPTDGSFGSLRDVALYIGGQWETKDFDKLHGEARIRLKLCLVAPSPACKIRYYFYDVGTVTLPPASGTA